MRKLWQTSKVKKKTGAGGEEYQIDEITDAKGEGVTLNAFILVQWGREGRQKIDHKVRTY